MSIIAGLFEPELRGRASLVVGADVAVMQIDGESRRIRVSITHPDEELSRFIVWCARPPTPAESGVRSIRDRVEGRSIGFVFPMTSLSPDSDYCAAKLDGQFAKIFSSVAVLALLKQGVANSWLRGDFATLGEGMSISDLFDSDLSVVVVGRENLANNGVSEASTKLLLQEAGYFLAELGSDYTWARVKPPESHVHCNLSRISSALVPIADLLATLVCLASQQSSAVASLLIYYQIVETVSEKVLFERLRRVSEAPPKDAWEFKEALSKAVSEKSRIRAICAQAAVDSDAATFLSMKDIGAKFLSSTGEGCDGLDDAGAVLYRVRNVVVHKQSAIPAASYKLLGSFVDSFHGAVFAIIRRFEVATIT